MRKTLIALFLAAAVPATAFAMPSDGHHRHGGHGQHMFRQLDLSAEQRSEVHQLMSTQMKAQREITRRYLDKLPAAEQKAMQDELKAARDNSQKDIRAVLTAEQQKAFDEHKQKMADRRAERQEFLKWKAEQKTN